MLMIQKVMNLDNEEKFQEDICDNFGDSNIDEENQNRLNSTKKRLIFSLRNLSPQVPEEEIKKRLYGLFLWMGFICLKVTESLWRGSLLFTTKFPENPGTHLMDLRRIKGRVDIRATQWFLNTVPLNWKSSIATTRPLLQEKWFAMTYPRKRRPTLIIGKGPKRFFVE